MNKPVAWMGIRRHGETRVSIEKLDKDDIPLYTHPIKEQKCMVHGCENHKHEGSFNGDVCSPCYQFIAHGKGVYSQAYRNTHPVKELTDEEIHYAVKRWEMHYNYKHDADVHESLHEFARAILRKAQEK